MKPVLLSLISVLVLSTILSACQQNQTSADVAPAVSDDFVVWTTSKKYKLYYEDSCALWNQQNPQNTIELTCELYDKKQLNYKLWYIFQAGYDCPDFVDLPYEYFGKYVSTEKQYFTELNDLIEQTKDVIDKDCLNRYCVNGTYFGLPYEVGNTVIYYNIDILYKAGINPNHIKTWEDFINAGKIVKEKTGKYILSVDIDNSVLFLGMLLQKGSHITDDMGKFTLDSKENIEVLQLIYDLLYKYQIAEIAHGLDHYNKEHFEHINENSVASLVMPISYMNEFIYQMPNMVKKYIVYPMPKWDVTDNYETAKIGNHCTCITKDCKNISKAKQFLSFLRLDQKAAVNMWNSLAVDPILIDAMDNVALYQTNRYTNYFRGNPLTVLRKVEKKSAHLNTMSKYNQVQKVLSEEVLMKVLIERSLSPEEAMHQAQKILDTMG